MSRSKLRCSADQGSHACQLFGLASAPLLLGPLLYGATQTVHEAQYVKGSQSRSRALTHCSRSFSLCALCCDMTGQQAGPLAGTPPSPTISSAAKQLKDYALFGDGLPGDEEPGQKLSKQTDSPALSGLCLVSQDFGTLCRLICTERLDGSLLCAFIINVHWRLLTPSQVCVFDCSVVLGGALWVICRIARRTELLPHGGEALSVKSQPGLQDFRDSSESSLLSDTELIGLERVDSIPKGKPCKLCIIDFFSLSPCTSCGLGYRWRKGNNSEGKYLRGQGLDQTGGGLRRDQYLHC